MIHIKRFIDKVTAMDKKQSISVTMPIDEARALKDEISKMLADLYQLQSAKPVEQIIQVELAGGKF